VDIEQSKKLMDILIENSARILREDFGVNFAENSLFSIIDLLKNQPKLKNHVLGRIATTLRELDPGLIDLNEGQVPTELIELIAHETRWAELRTLAEERISSKYNGDWRFARGDITQRILDAMEDNWENRDFYEHYKN
jgi:hypothetical protein